MKDSFDEVRSNKRSVLEVTGEWLQEKVFDLFTETRYFPELILSNHVSWVGGRGTGKNTALRGLSYVGQSAIAKKMGRIDSGATDFIGFIIA